MAFVVRSLGSMLSEQPVVGTPAEVGVMQQLVAKTPLARAVTTFRTAPQTYSAPLPTATAMGMRADGTVGLVAADLPRFNPGGSTGPSGPSGIDHRAPLDGDVNDASSGTQYPMVEDLPPADQVPPDGQMTVSGSVSGPTNWMLAAGIGVGLLAVVGIAVAVTR